ncbi:MAG: hypothetical protein LC803_00935 [Acidobacteria bacterium]|nr:hypothetical protein [Acidobacteriota bacterium]
MSTGEAIAALFAGLLGACLGVLLVYQGMRPGGDSWFKSRQSKYLQEHEAMNKILCRVAGVGFFLAGVGLLVRGIRELLQ